MVLNEFDIFIPFVRKSVLFGKFLKPSIYKLHNLLSMVVKWYIFASKYNKNPCVSFDLVKQIIKNKILLEKYLLLKTVDT